MIDYTVILSALGTFISSFLGVISSYKLISFRVHTLEEQVARNTKKIECLNERLLKIEIERDDNNGK